MWAARKQTPLADLLMELGWIEADDRREVDRLMERKLRKHAGSVKASLAAVSADNLRSLAAIRDEDIQRSLTGALSANGSPLATVDYTPPLRERYTRCSLHAAGGIGRIWVALDNELGRRVALKELHPDRADAPLALGRFLREARITSQLEHPGIVPIYDVGRCPETQRPYYTMRFVSGRTLAEATREFHLERAKSHPRPLDLVNLLSAFVVVCNTVAYAHARGVIHRDLKGQNVILGDFGEVVVLDWGLAKLASQPEQEKCGAPITPGEDWPADRHLTSEGQTIGTPVFMAPEQACGRLDLMDHRTDIYGLGAMLYEILTGQPPFAGLDSKEVLRKVVEEKPQPPHEIWEEVPPDLEVICSRAMAKEQASRYASARELGHNVQGWQDAQRRRTEEALRQSEAFYYALVDSLPHCILRKDLEGRFTFANQGACHYLGRPLEEIIGKTDRDVAPAELAEKYRRDDQHVLATGSVLETVEELQSLDGSRIHIQIIKAPVYDRQGVPIGTQVVFWDVTDRKRLEDEIRQKTAALARARDRLRSLGILRQTNEPWGPTQYFN